MDPRRDLLTSDECFEDLSDWRAERALFQQNLDVLKITIGRLHALRPAYQELIDLAQVNIQNACAVQSDLDSFATSFELAPMTGAVIQLPGHATAIPVRVQAKLDEKLKVAVS
jgi:hypothetical protein